MPLYQHLINFTQKPMETNKMKMTGKCSKCGKPMRRCECEKIKFHKGVVRGSDIPKYTEEQVRDAIKMAREPEYWESGNYWGELYTEDEIIEELNKSKTA